MFSLRNYLYIQDEHSCLEMAKDVAQNAPFNTYKLISSKIKKTNASSRLSVTENLTDSAEIRRKKIDALLKGDTENPTSTAISRRKVPRKGKEKEPEILEETENSPELSSYQHNIPVEKEDGWSFYMLGCQGNAKAAQQKVAALMNEIANNPQSKKPRFILLLGDNFYHWGVNSPEDNMFKTHFEEIYSANGIPCFVILGNHDENLHSASFPGQEKGMARGIHQIVYSYLPDKKFTTPQKIALYRHGIHHSNQNPHKEEKANTSHQTKQPVLDTDNLPYWNMPSRAYALSCGNTIVFCIDSNTYVLEYLAYINKDSTEPALAETDSGSINREMGMETNQAFWLAKNVHAAKVAGQQIILALHHPPRTTGRRAYKSDLKVYLSESELLIAQKHFAELWETTSGTPKPVSYNDLIYATLREQDLEFDAVLTAHDHAMYSIIENDESYRLYQFTSGGGGGDLQNQLCFKYQEKMGYYLREHGYTEVICNRINIRCVVRTLGGQHLEFDHNHLHPIRTYPKDIRQDEAMRIEKFCSVVRSGLKRFFEFCDKKQTRYQGYYFRQRLPLENTHEGVDKAQKVWAYISKKEADNYSITLQKVFDLVTWNGQLTTPSKHSLWKYIDDELAKTYEESESLQSLVMMESAFIESDLIEYEPSTKDPCEFGM